MKKILSKRNLAFTFMCVGILFFYLMYSHYEETRFTNMVRNERLRVLKRIRHTILESNVPFKDLSLFAILETNNMMGFPFVIPGNDSSESRNGFEFFVENGSRESFYNYCQYRLIKNDLNWWGIVESKLGRLNKTFLMLTCDGKVVEFKKPFLPTQFKHTAPLEKKAEK